jgi:hypothetical protein
MSLNHWGCDSCGSVSQSLLSAVNSYLSNPPVTFWGRYFSPSPPCTNMDLEGSAGIQAEATALKNNGTRYIVPLSSPGQVVYSGTFAQGSSDGQTFCGAVNKVINQSGGKIVLPGNGQLKVYLDVEGGANLSQLHYSGWSNAVISAVGPSSAGYPFYPSCYCDVPSYNYCSIFSSFPCYGVWATHPENYCGNCYSPGPGWGPNHCANSSPPTLVWQYAEADPVHCADCNSSSCRGCSYPNVDLDQSTPGEDEHAWMLYLP